MEKMTTPITNQIRIIERHFKKDCLSAADLDVLKAEIRLYCMRRDAQLNVSEEVTKHGTENHKG